MSVLHMLARMKLLVKDGDAEVEVWDVTGDIFNTSLGKIQDRAGFLEITDEFGAVALVPFDHVVRIAAVRASLKDLSK